MIVFDLQCQEDGETFEAWFRSSADYESQQEQGLVQCPVCQSGKVAKAPMAPRVPRKSSDSPLSKLAALQAEMLKRSRWVGDEFADTARKIHAGEIEPKLADPAGPVRTAVRVGPAFQLYELLVENRDREE